jgi:hypothetical protein
MNTVLCPRLFKPAVDTGKTNALVTDTLAVCKVVTPEATAERLVSALVTASSTNVPANEPVQTTLEGDGTESSPLKTTILIPLIQSGTAGSEDFGVVNLDGSPTHRGLFLATRGPPGTYNSLLSGDGVLVLTSPVPLSGLLLQVVNYESGTLPGEMTMTVFEENGLFVIPSTSYPDAVPGVSLDNPANDFPAANGIVRYDFASTLPANRKFTILLTTHVSDSVDAKFFITGIQAV